MHKLWCSIPIKTIWNSKLASLGQDSFLKLQERYLKQESDKATNDVCGRKNPMTQEKLKKKNYTP